MRRGDSARRPQPTRLVARTRCGHCACTCMDSDRRRVGEHQSRPLASGCLCILRDRRVRLSRCGLGGQAPKFACTAPPDDEFNVKYGGNNADAYGEVAASRLLWALGFGADRMYPVRIVCTGCPRDSAASPAMKTHSSPTLPSSNGPCRLRSFPVKMAGPGPSSTPLPRTPVRRRASTWTR